MKSCRKCKKTVINTDAKFCTMCGRKIFNDDDENVCTNDDCQRCKDRVVFLTSEIYCDLCGEKLVMFE